MNYLLGRRPYKFRFVIPHRQGVHNRIWASSQQLPPLINIAQLKRKQQLITSVNRNFYLCLEAIEIVENLEKQYAK